MRERLVVALVGLTVAVIALFGVPRAYFLADLVLAQEVRKVEDTANLVALVVDERTRADAFARDDLLDGLVGEGEGVRYVAPDGTTVAAGVEATSDHAILATRSLPGGGTVTLARSRALVDQEISVALMPLVMIGLTLTVASAIIGFWLARRLARPFQELAAAATSLGSGRFDEVRIGHYAIPEAENIGAALRGSSEQLAALLERERQFAANASHQLRTPITALRLQLEDLTYWPQTDPEVAAELNLSLAELDRLSAAITEFLELSRGLRRTLSVDVDLVQLAARACARWEPQFHARGRTLSLASRRPVPVRVQPGSVDQVLDVLLENAAKHGRGAVTVTVADEAQSVLVTVADEGRTPLGPDVFRRGASGSGGTGLGLALAVELGHALDGRLELGSGPGTSFVLRLPRSTDDES